MAKELTDKIKEEIIEAQIGYLKKDHPEKLFLFTNYSNLRESLTKALNQYLKDNSLPEDAIKEKVDYTLIKQLNQNLGGRVSRRLINCIISNIDVKSSSELENKDLLGFYNLAEVALAQGRYLPRQYGKKSHELLEQYLKEKKLIE
jgi:hypothetical protein